MYKSKFDKVLLRENGKIEWKVYRSNDGEDSYYIYMKIPSEVIESFYYDVVIRLFTKENKKKSNVNLREYAVEFYSNDPAFVFTFAHAFSKNKLFIKDLEPKMSKTALKDVAKVKNPKDNVWYVKSLYFAYLTMERYHLFNRTVLNQHSTKYNKKELLSKITYATEKVEARQQAQEKLDKEKAKAKLQKSRDKFLKDPEGLIQHCAEYCWNAEEAFNLEGDNKFNRILITDQLAEIRLHKRGPRPERGNLEYIFKTGKQTKENIEGFKWTPNLNSKLQILEHPIWSSEFKHSPTYKYYDPETIGT